MTNHKIMVTVIMPAYNAANYIETAMKSVEQQQVPLELFVINDCSTDDTAKIVREFAQRASCPVILLENETQSGAAESRNRGILRANGKYVAFLDADDWWQKEKLKEQLEFLEKTENVLCYTGRELMNEAGISTGRVIPVPDVVTYHSLLKTNSIPCSSVVMLRQVAQEFYMTNDELHEDYILWLKVLKKYKVAGGINKPMLKSRLSEKGKSRNKWKSARMQWGVYRLLGMNPIKASWYFFQYVWHGLRKYYG